MSRQYSTSVIYRRLFAQARPFWPHLAVLVVLGLLAPALKLLGPLPLKIAIDSVIGSGPPPKALDATLRVFGGPSTAATLVAVAVLMVLIALLNHTQGLATSVLRTYTGERLLLDFRGLLFRHAQRLSLSYHDSRGITDSTYRIQYDAPCIQWIIADGLIPFATSTLTLIAMIYVTLLMDWQLALVGLAISPLLLVISRVFGRKLRDCSSQLKDVESSTFSVVNEVLGAVRVVKAFGQEEREQTRYMAHSSRGMWARIRVAVAEESFSLLVGLTTALGTALVMYIGIRHVQAGTLTLGELLVVMAYLTQLYQPLETASKKLADLQASLVSAERSFSLLDEGPDVVERPNARPVERAVGAVRFDRVSFAYNPGHPVLREVSFDVPAGSRVGIAGTTGAGKTTLLNLLTRLYDPVEGQILLDGVDLRDYKLVDLRNQFTIVLQEPVLFSTTIAENIAYARPDATEDEVVAAAKAANAHEFIVELPHGYATRVGERGMHLSGGERQRISLARAFLKNAPLLILDEPTSSVDVQTESLIMEAMERLVAGRTTFIIAHRLSTLENCDVRLHVEHGRLTETSRTPQHDGQLVGAPASSPSAT